MKNAPLDSGHPETKPVRVWTVGRRVTLGFAAVLLAASVVGVLAWTGLSSIRTNATQITRDTLPTYRAINLIGILNRDNFILAQRYVMSPDKDLRAKLSAEMKANSEVMAGHLTAYEKLADTAEEKKVFESIKALRTPYIDARKEMISLSDQGKSAEAAVVVETKLFPAFDAYAAKIREAMEVTEKLSNRDGAEILASVSFADWSIRIGALVALALGLAISALISRSVTSILRSVSGRLEEGSAQVSSAASQVSDASNTLASSASQQAASLEETSASLEEIASMTRRNAENAKAAKDLANQTRSAAESGAGDMGEMSRAMDDVKVASSNISKIIKTIDEIAFQTNILALNAAVEAARAGEAGAGFAVVAEEVRNLAQRSAMAARETAESIEDAIGKSQRAVEISARVGGQLDQIVTKAREVDAIVGQIAGASQEQDQGISQITKAVTHMDTTTQSNAATSEESAAAAAELSSQARLLLTAVDELLALSGGSGKARPERETHLPTPPSPAPKAAVRIQTPHAPREVRPTVLAHSSEAHMKTGTHEVPKDFFNF